MNMRRSLRHSVSMAVLTVSVMVCGCSTPGNSIFKTDTEKAILSFTAGDHENAVHYAQMALKDNQYDTYAMMVAGLSYEQLGYPNRARAMYEQLATSDAEDISMLGAVRNVPADDLRKSAANRLHALNLPQSPIAAVNPETQEAKFTPLAFAENLTKEKGAVATPSEQVKSGLDMLSEGDRNVVMRFLTFIRLRDEKYVTEDEWQMRRSVNLGGLLPYTLTPAGKGLDMPSPTGDAIIGRMNALRNALEIRAITPREHAAEREIILEALLPSNPFYRMEHPPVPQDILEGATILRRLEMLQNIKLITPDEAKKEKAAVEKLIYAKIGMTGEDGQSRPQVSSCIQKCVSAPVSPCAAAAPAKKKATLPQKKKAVKKKAAAKKAAPKACPCS